MFAEKKERKNHVVECENSLKDEVTMKNRTTVSIAVPSIICTGLPNSCNFNSVGKASIYFGLDSHLSM